MENTKTPLTIDITAPIEELTYSAVPVVTNDFTHDQLIAALYHIWDAFDRANMRWFLVGDTAQLVTMNRDLEGNGIDAGIRLMEWRSGSKNIFDLFMGQPEAEDKNVLTYFHQGVPIRLHIYEPDDECIIATNPLMYRNENFSVPNPFTRFEELYHKEDIN